MSQRRRYGEDLTYAEWHRAAFPELYGRIGHRIDMADRDWTENCHYCREPLLIVEEVRDRGQDLLDKGTSVTRRLAERANLPAALMAWRSDRPKEVDREINTLHARIRELEAGWPIVGFTVRYLRRRDSLRLHRLTPAEWLEWLAIQHREHHAQCEKANEFPVRRDRLIAVRDAHALHEPSLLDGLLDTA